MRGCTIFNDIYVFFIGKLITFLSMLGNFNDAVRKKTPPPNSISSCPVIELATPEQTPSSLEAKTQFGLSM